MNANCDQPAIDVPNLSIRDVPEAITEHLRQREARHHRSLQGELMAILESAVAADLQATATQPAQTRPTATPRRSLADLLRTMRERTGVDVATPSTSTATVREMRDSRDPGCGA
jgi:plasmid stability protein